MTPFTKFTATALIFLASTVAFADTIQLGSYATGAPSMGNANSALNFAGFSAISSLPLAGTGSTFTLSPGTTWGAAAANTTWVGAAPTAGPLGTNPALGYYTFNTNFTTLSAGVYSGVLSLMADDTAEVLLNGNVLVPFGTLGSDGHCAQSGPSCTVFDNVTLNGLSLRSGTNANTLTFVVQQAGNFNANGLDPSGVDFTAILTGSNVPEPGTMSLMLTGLGLLSGALLMRRRAAVRIA